MANFFGSAWGVLISIAVVPLYLHYLGAEGYGVVGFSTTLFSIVAFLDGGLTLTINREFARLSNSPSNAPQMHETLSAGTIVFSAMAALIAVVIWAAAPWIARDWLNAQHLTIDELVVSLRLVGFVLGEQLLWALFQGALSGLHRQVTANLILVGGLTVRAVGAIFVLKYLSATPSAFFAWYGATLLAQILVTRMLLGGYIGGRGAFAVPGTETFKTLFLQTRGFGAIAILSLLLSQVDKLLVSRLLTLQDFGYYMVAVSVSLAPLLISGPVTNAFFPQLARFAHTNPPEALRVFHFGTRLVASVVVPVGFSLALFSREAIFAWTGNAAITAHVAPIVTILIAGYAINASLQMSYYYEMAYGRTRTIFFVNVVALFLLIPGLIVLSTKFGAVGVAGCWFLLNIGLMFVSLPIVLRPGLGGGEVWRYYARSLLPPYLITLPVLAAARLAVPEGLPRFWGGAVTVLVAALAVAACFAALPSLRSLIVRRGRDLYASLAQHV